MNYFVMEKELFSIIETCVHFRNFLLGFTVNILLRGQCDLLTILAFLLILDNLLLDTIWSSVQQTSQTGITFAKCPSKILLITTDVRIAVVFLASTKWGKCVFIIQWYQTQAFPRQGPFLIADEFSNDTVSAQHSAKARERINTRRVHPIF